MTSAIPIVPPVVTTLCGTEMAFTALKLRTGLGQGTELKLAILQKTLHNDVLNI